MSKTTEWITVEEAAKRMGKSQEFVRAGLRFGRLPIGFAVNITGKRWSYFISRKKLEEYIG